MNKPDPNLLMAYLFGELSREESEKVRHILQQNPAWQEELQELKSTHFILEQLEEKDVPVPQFILPENIKSRAINAQLRRIRQVLSWAAVFLLLLMLGFWMKLRVSWHDQQLVLSFGDLAGQKIQNRWAQTQNQYQVVQNELDSLKHWILLRESLQASHLDSTLQNIAGRLHNQGNQLQLLSNPPPIPKPEELISLLEAQQSQWISQIVQQISQQYQELNEENLANLVLFLQKQREEDLQAIFTNLQMIQLDQENQEIEQNQILDEILISLYKKQKIDE